MTKPSYFESFLMLNSSEIPYFSIASNAPENRSQEYLKYYALHNFIKVVQANLCLSGSIIPAFRPLWSAEKQHFDL